MYNLWKLSKKTSKCLCLTYFYHAYGLLSIILKIFWLFSYPHVYFLPLVFQSPPVISLIINFLFPPLNF
jgi:hypothetical protein